MAALPVALDVPNRKRGLCVKGVGRRAFPLHTGPAFAARCHLDSMGAEAVGPLGRCRLRRHPTAGTEAVSSSGGRSIHAHAAPCCCCCYQLPSHCNPAHTRSNQDRSPPWSRPSINRSSPVGAWGRVSGRKDGRRSSRQRPLVRLQVWRHQVRVSLLCASATPGAGMVLPPALGSIDRFTIHPASLINQPSQSLHAQLQPHLKPNKQNSVASAACYRTVRDIILEAQASNPKMAVVVSAMGGKPKVCLYICVCTMAWGFDRVRRTQRY